MAADTVKVLLCFCDIKPTAEVRPIAQLATAPSGVDALVVAEVAEAASVRALARGGQLGQDDLTLISGVIMVAGDSRMQRRAAALGEGALDSFFFEVAEYVWVALGSALEQESFVLVAYAVAVAG